MPDVEEQRRYCGDAKYGNDNVAEPPPIGKDCCDQPPVILGSLRLQARARLKST